MHEILSLVFSCLNVQNQVYNLSSCVYWIVTGEQCGSGRRAHGLHVGALENDALPGQPLHVGGDDVGVVPGDIVETCDCLVN